MQPLQTYGLMAPNRHGSLISILSFSSALAGSKQSGPGLWDSMRMQWVLCTWTICCCDQAMVHGVVWSWLHGRPVGFRLGDGGQSRCKQGVIQSSATRPGRQDDILSTAGASVVADLGFKSMWTVRELGNECFGGPLVWSRIVSNVPIWFW